MQHEDDKKTLVHKCKADYRVAPTRNRDSAWQYIEAHRPITFGGIQALAGHQTIT